MVAVNAKRLTRFVTARLQDGEGKSERGGGGENAEGGRETSLSPIPGSSVFVLLGVLLSWSSLK